MLQIYLRARTLSISPCVLLIIEYGTRTVHCRFPNYPLILHLYSGLKDEYNCPALMLLVIIPHYLRLVMIVAFIMNALLIYYQVAAVCYNKFHHIFIPCSRIL